MTDRIVKDFNLNLPVFEQVEEDGGSHRLHHDSPEFRLLMAVLERAALDCLGSDPRESKEAELWLFEQNDTPFSYEWICSLLDIPEDSLRRGIRKRLRGPGLAEKPGNRGEEL